jgi:hypothetical protein
MAIAERLSSTTTYPWSLLIEEAVKSVAMWRPEVPGGGRKTTLIHWKICRVGLAVVLIAAVLVEIES